MAATKFQWTLLILLVLSPFAPQAAAQISGSLVAPQLPQELSAIPEEYMGYTRFVGENLLQFDYKSSYLKKLSPGGKAYFLANRREYAKALALTQQLPNKHTGSYLYLRAFCLEGIGSHREAVQSYIAAKSKINLVFHPGFRFYLHSSTAQLRAGNVKDCLADLDIAAKKLGDYPSDQMCFAPVNDLIVKRKGVAIEKRGHYREAFEYYLAIFNKDRDQFHLSENLTSDAAAKKRAESWLKSHISAPEKASREEICRFLLTQGKAQLTGGDTSAAKVVLEKLVSIEAEDRSPFEYSRVIDETRSPLMKIKDQGKVLLVKVFFKEKNFLKACAVIRTLFTRDPVKELDDHYNTISMRDVPQLVLQKDVDQHDTRIEHDIEICEPVIYSPTKEQMERVYNFAQDPMWRKACSEVQAARFSDCYDTLGSFLEENLADSRTLEVPDFSTLSRYILFDADFARRAKLMQSAVGIAGKKSVRSLSVFGGMCRRMSAAWVAIDQILLGRKTAVQLPDSRAWTDKKIMSLVQFDAYCHFAAASRAMSLKDFKTAVREFDLASKKTPDSADLVVFAQALKKYCEQQK